MATHRISAVDAATVCTIQFLCQRDLHEIPGDLERYHLGCLCFLNDLITFEKHNCCSSLNVFRQMWETCISEGGLGEVPCTFIDAALTGIAFIAQDLDDFIGIFDTAKELLQASNSSDPPSEIEISYVSPDSLLGIELRRIIAGTSKLPFDGMATVFEAFQKWCGVSSTIPRVNHKPQTSMGHPNRLAEADKLLESGFIHSALETAHQYFDYQVMNPAGDSTTPANNHEAALLYHAGICVRSGFIDQALVTLESVVKLAQQRSRHDVVAVASLWLHHVLTRCNVRKVMQSIPVHSNTVTTVMTLPPPPRQSPVLCASSEVVLLRCLMRASSLGLSHVAALATLAFAKEIIFPGTDVETASDKPTDSTWALNSLRHGLAMQAVAELGDVPAMLSLVRAWVDSSKADEVITSASKTTAKMLDAAGWAMLLPKSMLLHQESCFTNSMFELENTFAQCLLHYPQHCSSTELAMCLAKMFRVRALTGSCTIPTQNWCELMSNHVSKAKLLLQTHQADLNRDLDVVLYEICFSWALHTRDTATTESYLEAFESATIPLADEAPVDVIRARIYRAQFLIQCIGAYDEALNLLHETLRLADTLHLPALSVTIILLRADVHSRLGYTRAALDDCKQAFEIAKKGQNPVGCSQSLIAMSAALLKLGKATNAFQAVQAAYGTMLAFGSNAQKATASLAFAAAIRPIALQMTEVSPKWTEAVLQAIAASRLANRLYSQIGDQSFAQEAVELEESLYQIYNHRVQSQSSNTLTQQLCVPNHTVLVKTWDGVTDFL